MSDSFNLCEYFLGEERLAQINGNPAIEFRGQSITYRDLRTRVVNWAARFAPMEAEPGDTVVLYLYDSPELVASFLAATWLGLVAVPVNTFLPAESVKFILDDCRAKILVVESDLLEAFRAEAAAFDGNKHLLSVDTGSRKILDHNRFAARLKPPRMTRDSPAFILYTSGSTGAPKGVLHTHGAIPATVESYAATVLKLQPGDRTYSASRMFFAYGLGNSLSFPLAAGATAILHTERPTPQTVASVLDKCSPTVFFGVPSLYRALIELHKQSTPVNTTSLRLCVSAGEALPASVFQEWKQAFGISILDGIGSTEMLHIFISNHPGDERPGATGTIVKGYDARLLDEGGEPLSGDGTGNLWVRGESAFAEYLNLPDLTAETIRDGWVRTGDTYRREADRYYYYVGRSDDCFKVKGMWVSPIEVEAALISHDAVVETAVVPDLDSSGLATVHAFVVIGRNGESGDLLADLLSHARARLPGHKMPAVITIVDELPRTATGKIQRFKLRNK